MAPHAQFEFEPTRKFTRSARHFARNTALAHGWRRSAQRASSSPSQGQRPWDSGSLPIQAPTGRQFALDTQFEI